MIKQLLFPISLLIAISSNAQRVNYPPAPSSVYASHKQEVEPTQKATLWSDDVSMSTNWSFTNTSTPILDWSIQTDSTIVSTSGPFQSASTSNGFLVVKSDTSTGAAADAYAEYVGAPIDLTGFPNIRIQFEQQFISDSNQRILEVSQDGISWSPFVVSDGISPTGAKHNDLKSIDISSVAGNAGSLHFRFHFSGTQEGYWAIDDVQLQSIDSVDLRAVRVDWGTTGAWGVRMPYYSVIPSQVQPIEFCAVVANEGLLDIDSATYEVQVSPFSFVSSDTFSIQAGIIDVVCSSSPFLMSGNVNYISDQMLNANLQETNVLNNSFEGFQFREDYSIWTTYARDDLFSEVEGGICEVEELGVEYSVGNVFDFFTYEYVYAITVHIHPEANLNSTISGQLYVFEDSTNTWELINQTLEMSLQQGDLDNEIILPFYSGPYPIEPNKSYLAMASSYSHGDSSKVFATSGKSKPNTSFYNSSWNWMNPELSYLTETPMVRLYFHPEGLNENQSDFNLSIHPNPTNKLTTVSFDLPSNSSVNFSIVDVSGKKIEQTESILYQEGKNQYELNTRALLNGVYFVTFTSDFGSTTKRIVVQH